jgi:SmpA/OmlA family protein
MRTARWRVQVVGIILLCSIPLLGCGSKVSQENFDKIQTGMTQAEVTSILGSPTESNSIAFGSIGGTTSTWKDNSGTITIQFVNDKVVAKAFSGKKS